MDPTVTEFTGSSLPEGWTAQAPAGAQVRTAGRYAELWIEPGRTFNSLSSSVHAPQGPLIWRQVDGPFDFAVALAEEATNLPNQGIDLLALTEAMNGVRFCTFSGAQTSTFRNDISWFVRDHLGNHTVLNTSGDGPMSGLYGGPGWLRLAWDGATYTCYASHTGMPGDWHVIAQFASSTVPTRFALHATAFPSGADGRTQRVARVVDLAARGTDDATTAPPELEPDVRHLYDGGSVPAWLSPDVASGGTVTEHPDGLELAVTGEVGSHAWLLGPDDLPVDHGLLVRYQLANSGAVNHFWVPAICVSATTDVPGARTPDDKWGRGTCLLLEMPARIHAADGQLVRLLRKSPNAIGETQTGNREFDGFTMLVEDANAPVSTVGAPVTWLRLERAGARVRARMWYADQAEPAGWDYEVEDWMRFGTGVVLSLAHNDSFAGTSAVLLSHIEAYALVDDPGPEPPPAVTPGTLTAGGHAAATLTTGGAP